MAFIDGLVVAFLCGCFFSLALGMGAAYLLVLAQGWSFSDFFATSFVATSLVGVWIMPIALFFGLLYGVIRSAVGLQSNSETESRI